MDPKRFNKGIEKFCNDTTMHGFKELYYTNSICIRITWILLIVSALGTATYQITNAVQQYQDHPTTTVIQPLDYSPRYTPVQICYLHWIYWVDWEKALGLGFTKESVLYALSFLTSIYSTTTFDMGKAKEQFTKTMEQRKLANLTEFYFAIAKDEPPGFISAEGLGNFTKKFHEYWSNEMCYLAFPKSLVSQYLTSINRQTVSMVYNGNYTRSRDHVNLAEYSHYMFAFLDSQIKSVDLEAHILPPAVAVDGRFDDVLVSLDIYVYLIKVQMSVQKWKNTEQKPCRQNSIQLTPISDCWQMCQLRNEIYKTSGCVTFQQAITVKNESFASICQNDIIFFDENDTRLPDVGYNAMNVAALDSTKNESYTVDRENCNETCLPSCEEWRFDYHIDTKTFLSESLQNRFTSVKVNYPAPSSILVMNEIDSQTWEDLIGNVGGLMGLWLGASIISFLQCVDLCCCHQHRDDTTTAVMTIKKRMNALKK